MKDFKFKTVFSSTIRPLVSPDKDIYLAKASLAQLRDLIPPIDTDRNYDLLPVSVNLFNVNLFNKNDDGVDTSFALDIYKTFINKPLNVDHRRSDSNIGVILSAYITEMGTDKILTEEEARNRKDPFNISIGGVIWRAVNSEVADLIEDTNSLLSDNFGKLSASFEVGFTDFKVVKCKEGCRNLMEGSVIEDPEEFDSLVANLRCFGGTGKTKDGFKLYRLLAGEGLGLGGAITESPAGFLGPIAVDKHEEEDCKDCESEMDACLKELKLVEPWRDKETREQLINIAQNHNIQPKEDKQEADATTQTAGLVSIYDPRRSDSITLTTTSTSDSTSDLVIDLKNKISLSDESNVITNKNSNSRKHMKINSIKDINDELLKECKASAIIDFVETELKAASEKYAKEQKEKEALAQEIEKKHQDLLATHETLKKELENIKANLEKLEQEKQAKDKQEKFNVRMASFEDKFELSEEELSVVASQIKDVSDEDYSKVEANLSVLLKNKDKKALAAQKKVKEEAKASVETKGDIEVSVEKALEKAEGVSKEIPATSSVQTPTLREKFEKAFAPDQFEVTR